MASKGGIVIGDAVFGAAVVGLAVGVWVIGVGVTGLGVTGLGVTDGAAVDGLAVTGALDTGLPVTAAPVPNTGLMVDGAPVPKTTGLEVVGVTVRVTDVAGATLIGPGLTCAPVTGLDTNVGLAVVGTSCPQKDTTKDKSLLSSTRILCIVCLLCPPRSLL